MFPLGYRVGSFVIYERAYPIYVKGGGLDAMRKHSLITFMLILLFIVMARGSPAMADNLSKYGNNSLQATITKLGANDPDVIDARDYDFKRMWAIQNPQTKELSSLKWITRTQMASSTTGIKYCTKEGSFKVAFLALVFF